MTIKEASREAKRVLGHLGVAVLVLRAEAPCRVGIQGEYGLDIRGRGNSWAEAFEDVRARERQDWHERQRRIVQVKARRLEQAQAVQRVAV